MDKLKEKGRLVIRRAYADWGRFSSRKREMLENCIDMIELPSYSERGKNSADIKLVVDVLETLFNKLYIDVFIIISGDSDYIPLISKLKEYTKYVIVVGYSPTNTNYLIKNYCDELIYYSSLAGIQTTEAVREKNLTSLYELFIKAVKELTEKGLEKRGSQVKQYMKSLDSTFDESNYGFSQFKNFLQAAEKDKIVTLQDIGGGDYIVSLTQGDDLGNSVLSSDSIEKMQWLVFWAIKANIISNDNKVLMGTVNETLNLLDTNFNIINYGISKSKGFKYFIEKYFKSTNLLKIESNDKCETFLTITSTFESLYDSSIAPDNFDAVRLRIILRKLNLLCNVKQIIIFSDCFNNVLRELNGQEISLTRALEITKNQLSDTSAPNNFSNVMSQKIINILLRTQSFQDSDSNPIRDLNEQNSHINLLPIEQIILNLKKLIEMEIKRNFNDDVEEATISKLLSS